MEMLYGFLTSGLNPSLIQKGLRRSTKAQAEDAETFESFPDSEGIKTYRRSPSPY